MTPLSVFEAEKAIFAQLRDFGTEKIPLEAAPGRILRQEVRAERDSPPFNRVMMDGIACRADAVFPLKTLGLHGAGHGLKSLPPGPVCWEVMTGAVMPSGAEVVIPIEALERTGESFSFRKGENPAEYLRFGRFIHPRAADAAAGALLLRSGCVINAAVMAVLAANGAARVQVARMPEAAVIVTGDELAEVGAVPGESQIRRSNDFMLRGILARAGIHSPKTEKVPDNPEAIRQAIRRLLKMHDILLLSGGVSMGEFDYVPQALADEGVRKIFHRVRQKPGAPLWFGAGPDGQLVFGLPGNPVSAAVCAARYVLPALRRAMGMAEWQAPRVTLSRAPEALTGRTRFVAAGPAEGGLAGAMQPLDAPTSGDFMHLANSAGIVEVAEASGQTPSERVYPFYGW